MDFNATYTYTDAGATQPTTITPRIRRRTRNGNELTTINGLAPLLADRLNAIADPERRLQTLTVLEAAVIAISTQPRDFGSAIANRDEGRISTTYTGTRDLPVAAVLDLAEQIRTLLA